MRLCSATTLEYYLQETAAVLVLPKLPKAVRKRVVAASCFANALRDLAMLTAHDAAYVGVGGGARDGNAIRCPLQTSTPFVPKWKRLNRESMFA